ncbi:MAG: diaminopimelate epimerase [Bacillota bacterium]|jgi:diaminopimelate epimerase
MRFVKMHGLGNDFIMVNGFKEHLPSDLSTLAAALCHRQLGIGADGLIIIGPSDEADACFDIYNADGSRAEMCGNGIRCAAIFAKREGISDKSIVPFSTLAGLVKAQIVDEAANLVKVDMGQPKLATKDIPANFSGPLMVNAPIIVGHKTYNLTLVSMGNPHCVLFVDDVANYPVTTLGPDIETHSLFPCKTNVEFVQPLGNNKIRMRVWERGCGETLACGTGACAAAVAAILNGYCQKEQDVEVILAHGSLIINWHQDDHITMIGPAATVFEGNIIL